MSDTLPPSVQFLTTRDTPGPEAPGRPLVAKIPGSHPPPGSSAAHAKQAPRSRAKLPVRQTERGGMRLGLVVAVPLACGPGWPGYGIRSELRSVSRFLLGPRASGLLLFLISRPLCGFLLLDTLQCVLRTPLDKIPYRPARFLLGDLAFFVRLQHLFHRPRRESDDVLGCGVF